MNQVYQRYRPHQISQYTIRMALAKLVSPVSHRQALTKTWFWLLFWMLTVALPSYVAQAKSLGEVKILGRVRPNTPGGRVLPNSAMITSGGSTTSSNIPSTTVNTAVNLAIQKASAAIHQADYALAIICSVSATAQATCHNNGTLDNAADDYITFVLTPYSNVQGSRFTLTATQAGSPIALSLSDGSSLTALSYAYPTPFRTPVGTAGKGPITLTLTDVDNTTCTTQVTVADPGPCAQATCVGSTQTSVTYTYQTPFKLTELIDEPLPLNQFDTGGGTRTLTGVTLTYKIYEAANYVFENTAAVPITIRATLSGSGDIQLNGTPIITAGFPTVSTGAVSLSAGITVGAQGTYPGDALSGGRLSTLKGMEPWLAPLQEDIFLDPRLDPRWVTNATGNASYDDDIYVWSPQSFSASGVSTYTATADLTQFIGSGTLPLTANTLNGVSITGSGGNIITSQVTKAYALATVVYTYVCTPCNLAATVTPGTCNSATNQYDVTGSISLTNNTGGGIATITDGATSTTLGVPASATSVAYSLTGLTSGTGSHTVTVSLPGCGTAMATYSAPASCTVAPCGVALTLTPGLCLPADNSYVLSGTITVTNVPTSGTLTITSGAFAPRSLTLPAANTASGTFSYSGLVSNGQTYTVTASYSNSACAPVSQTYTAPVSCSVAPPCTLSAVASAGICASATNTYSASVAIALSNAPAGTITVSLPGSTPISQTLAANTSSFTAVFAGLTSDGASHTATISLPGCGTTTATFTAPASCSVAPPCSISAVVTAGQCASATNTFSTTAVVTLSNPTAGVLTITDGPASQTFATTAVTTATFTAVFAGIPSDGTIRTVTATLPGCSTTSAAYTAPASCSVAPPCSISANVTAGICASATNTYSATAIITVNNPTAGTLTVQNGAQTLTFSTTAASQNTFTAVFNGLVSDGASHTVTATLPGCSSETATYTAPTSCSVAPVCTLAVTASGANCDPATNLYVLTGTITLTNSPASQTLTLTDGSYVRSLTANAGTTTISFSYTTLQSDGAVHTLTVASSATTCGTASTTYTAPAACTVCSMNAVVTAGQCASATNTYSSTVVVSVMNTGSGGTLTITDKGISQTLTVGAGLTNFTGTLTFNGLTSDGSVHPVSASLSGCSSATATYTAPSACTVCSLSLTSSALSNGQVGSPYSQTLTATGGNAPLSYTLSGGSLPAGFALDPTTGVISGTPTTSGSASFTITVSDAKSCSDSAPLTITTSSAPVCSLTATATPGTCNSATNTYTVTGTVSATNVAVNNASPQTLTITDGTASTLVVLTGNGPVSYTLTGINSDGAVHTVTVMSSATVCGMTSLTYTAPVSCSVAPCQLLTPVVSVASCPTPNNLYSSTVVVTVNNPTGGQSLTVTDGALSQVFTTTTASANTFTMVFNGITADGANRTVMATLSGCGTTSTTYTAPAALTATLSSATICAGQSATLTATGGSSYTFSTGTVNTTGTLVVSPASTTTYSVSVANASGCVSATSAIVTVNPVPAIQVKPMAASCTGATANNDASISLLGSTNAVSYNISLGSSYNASAPLFATNQVLPAVGGNLLSGQANPGQAPGTSYSVRVYSASGCYSDVVVVIPPAQCQCPPAKCVPITVQRIVR